MQALLQRPLPALSFPSFIGAVVLLMAFVQSQLLSASAASPLTPQQALAAFQSEPGLHVELVASEPAVVSPVAIAFDEVGRMYVAENRGYPTGPGAGRPPSGMIALLEDKDGDGRFETRTDFAHGLTFPNGVMPWKGGVFVTCAPDLLYLKDTDGDGRADVRRVVLAGFDAGNTTQLRVSHPTLGLDNWIYLTSGLTGGSKVTTPDHPERGAVDVRTDLRFHPDTLEIEPLEGRAQFGMTFDDFGRRFICMNRVQVQHVVLPARYLRRNPYLAFSDSVQNCPEHMLPEPLKGHGSSARIYPISDNVTTADSHAGTFTAACGVLIYRGNGLPKSYYGQAFSCDPTGNLVHRDELIPTGATFVARRASEPVEFLASTDNWFRPVFLANGPDGALYVCDMYRKTIEHPQYLPEAVRKRTDFESGKEMGRIYRITAATNSKRPPLKSSAAATSKQLCDRLNDANAWQADTARRLLLERNPTDAKALLKSKLRATKNSTAPGRARALWTLEGLGVLDDDSIRLALRDPSPGVQESAIQTVETRLRRSSQSPWLDHLAPLAESRDSRVRFQCALALGEIQNAQCLPLLARIAQKDAIDRWSRAAVLSSLHTSSSAQKIRAERFRAALTSAVRDPSDPMLLFLEELGRMLGSGSTLDDFKSSSIGVMLWSARATPEVETPLLAGFADGSRGQRRNAAARINPTGFVASIHQIDENLGKRIDILCARAATIAVDGQQTLGSRLAAVHLLAHADVQVSSGPLLRLIDPHQPSALQVAAVRALVQSADVRATALLLKREAWNNHTPALRETLLATLLSDPRHGSGLLDAVESGQLSPSAFDSNRRNQLLKHRDEKIRERAERLFKTNQSGDRLKVFEESKSVLNLAANPQNGRSIFKQHCSACHRLDREGVAVGPDLFSIRNQPKEAILLHVLVPDYEIVPGFGGYVIETKDGRTLSGLIASETESSITLRGALGQEDVVLRSNVTSISSTAMSLMPQELEKNMTRQELADLIAYLKGE